MIVNCHAIYGEILGHLNETSIFETKVPYDGRKPGSGQRRSKAFCRFLPFPHTTDRNVVRAGLELVPTALVKDPWVIALDSPVTN